MKNFIEGKLKVKVVLFICGLFMFINCEASSEADIVKSIESYDFSYKDPFFATFRENCDTPIASFNNKKITESRTFFSTKLLEKKLPIDEFIFNDGGSRERTLTIINPGIFTNLNHNHGRFLAMRTTEAGSHAIVIPNALGTEYLSTMPHFLPGDIEKEGELILEITYQKIQELKKRNIKIGKVILMGVSYGSFLASVAMTKDQAKQNKIDKVLVFSPPLNMNMALKNLDRALDETVEGYNFLGKTLNFFNAIKYCKITDEGLLNKADLFKIKFMTAYLGFHTWLVNSLNIFSDLHPSALALPERHFGLFSKKYRDWRRHMRFEKFINLVNPLATKILNGPKGKLEWWLDQVPEKKIFVLTSADDFIVDGVERPNRPWLFEIRNGGHFGIQATAFFADLFKELIKRE
jgi:hypothetical protein